MLDGFKKFIMRGNVIDLAVGVIIGAAFKPIIGALTDRILLRFISAIFGKPSFNEVGTFYIGTAPIEPGFLITAVVNFLIVAAPLLLYRHADEQAGRTQEVRPGRSRGGSLGRSPPPHGDQGRPHQRRPGASPPVGRQPQQSCGARGRLASHFHVGAAWLQRDLRCDSSAPPGFGVRCSVWSRRPSTLGGLPRQSALEGLERCERRARATRNAGVCSPAGGVRRRRGRRRRAVPRASPIGSPSGRRGEEPLPERRSRRGPSARRRGGTA